MEVTRRSHVVIRISISLFVAENEMNGMTVKELEKEKMGIARMGFELKSKRQVSRC